MAFQVYHDYCDLVRVVSQPWESASKCSLPSSLRALQPRAGGDGAITERNGTDVPDIARRFLDAAPSGTGSFHESVVRSQIKELPQYRCDALIAEVAEQS